MTGPWNMGGLPVPPPYQRNEAPNTNAFRDHGFTDDLNTLRYRAAWQNFMHTRPPVAPAPAAPVPRAPLVTVPPFVYGRTTPPRYEPPASRPPVGSPAAPVMRAPEVFIPTAARAPAPVVIAPPVYRSPDGTRRAEDEPHGVPPAPPTRQPRQPNALPSPSWTKKWWIDRGTGADTEERGGSEKAKDVPAPPKEASTLDRAVAAARGLYRRAYAATLPIDFYRPPMRGDFFPSYQRIGDTGSFWSNRYLQALWSVYNLVVAFENSAGNALAGASDFMEWLAENGVDVNAIPQLELLRVEEFAGAAAVEFPELVSFLRRGGGTPEEMAGVEPDAAVFAEEVLEFLRGLMANTAGGARSIQVEPSLRNARWATAGWLRDSKALWNQPWFKWERFVQQSYGQLGDRALYASGVEFDSYAQRGAQKVLVDAKYGFPRGWYDMRRLLSAKKISVDDYAKGRAFIVTVRRQLLAMDRSGATNIEWVLPDPTVAKSLNDAFAKMGTIRIGSRMVKVADCVQAVVPANVPEELLR